MKYIKLFELKKKQEPFVDAAGKGQIGIIKKLLKSGVDINVKDEYGYTALMKATTNRFLSIVSLLINAGADVNAQDNHGRTALILYSTPTIINKLLDAGADVNVHDNNGNTALMKYINFSGSISTDAMCSFLDRFLEKGLNLYSQNKKGETFYEILQNENQLQTEWRHFWLETIIDYVDKIQPEQRKEWEFKNDIKKYNL